MQVRDTPDPRPRRSDCPVNLAVETLGDRWSLLVVRDLVFGGPATYTELLRAPEHIATNILVDRLSRLESVGLVARKQGRYRLTTAGADLVPVVLALYRFGAEFDPAPRGDTTRLHRIRNDGEAFEWELRARIAEAQDPSPGRPEAGDHPGGETG